MRRFVFGVAFLALSGSYTSVLAQEECLPVLRSDTVDLSHETEKNLVLLEKRLQDNSSQNSGEAVASYGGFSFNAEQAKQARSILSTLLEIEYSAKEKESLYLSTLSDNAVKAYVACLRDRSDPVSHNFVGDILNRDSFFIQINWHPDYRPDGETQRLVAKVTQGTFAESGSNTYSTDIKVTDQHFITVVRDPFRPTQIAVMIDGKVELIDVPARARYRIVQSEVTGPYRETITRETSGDVGWTACAELAPDDIDRAIIPNSGQFVFERAQVVNVRLIATNPWTISPRSACSHLGIVFNEIWSSSANVKAAPRAQVFLRVDEMPTPHEAAAAESAISLNEE